MNLRLRNLKDDKGFSLVELIIVCGMVGLVMAAIFTLYQAHQRTAYTQEEVVEVQQNLRIAMDSISRDLKMAGFMVPGGTNPLGVATATTLTINTASQGGKYARIVSANQTVTLALNDIINLSVDSVDNFDSNDVNNSVVRIIKPQNSEQAVSISFTITGVNPSAVCGTAAAPCLILKANAGGSGSIGKSDIIARTGTILSESYPNTIAYLVDSSGECPTGQNCIQRDPGTAAIVANNIKAAGLSFGYILDNGTETSVPDLTQIRAVRVTITGETVVTTALSGGQAKQRQIASIVRIRNR